MNILLPGSGSLATLGFNDLLILARRGFQNIGTKYQNAALQSFLEKNLNFLSKGLYLGVNRDIRDKIFTYVEAVSSGKLSDVEVRVTSLVSQGALKADSICRALIPSLLTKADRLRRGKTKRTGTSDVDVEGLAELGFALGQSLKIPAVQKAFGLSRGVARPKVDYQLPYLPHFFASEGRELEQAVRSSIALLDAESNRAYMLIRDECVYAKSWGLLYGLVLEHL